jgi:plasmid replication initiation protein
VPKRKKLPTVPDYKNTGRNGTKLTVQKSSPLQSLSETSLSLSEFKILDAYLSRINSHEPDRRYVRFEKGQLEKLLGVERIHKEELSKRLDNLFTAVTLHDENKPKGFIKIGLFSKAEANLDENGQWQVDLACTPEAMEYIFNIDNIGYLRYRLKNVIELTSRYSYVLYLYLEQNRFKKSWEVSLSELKKLLNCTADTYTQYYRFNDLILKKCHKELQEKTTIDFTYEPIKKGRKVVAVRFTLATLSDEFIKDSNQLVFDEQINVHVQSDDEEEKWLKVYGSEQLAILAESCQYEFSKEDMEQIFRVLTRINIPKDHNTGDLTWGRHFYLREKYAALNAEASKKERKGEKPIKDRYRYFLSMLEKDTFQPTAYTE